MIESAWLYNGFASSSGMERAHDVVRRVAAAATDTPGYVLDLGCGNGRLISAIAERTHSQPCGVESNGVRWQAAVENHKHGIWHHRLIQETEWWAGVDDHLLYHYQLILLMPGRLLEMAGPERERVKVMLHRCTEHLILYAYDDLLTKHGDLWGLISHTRLCNPVVSKDGRTWWQWERQEHGKAQGVEAWHLYQRSWSLPYQGPNPFETHGMIP